MTRSQPLGFQAHTHSKNGQDFPKGYVLENGFSLMHPHGRVIIGGLVATESGLCAQLGSTGPVGTGYEDLGDTQLNLLVKGL
jgi:hypothetical protein